MSENYEELLKHLADIHNLYMAMALLRWDQETTMPSGGAEARAAQLATLSRLNHEMLTSDRTGQLLEAARADLDGADYESDEASMIRVAQQDYEDAIKLPADFVAEMARITSLANHVWIEAREKKDFETFRPQLEQIIDMKKQEAEYRGYEDDPYDALLNQYERGMTTARVRDIFEAHKPVLVDLIAAISDVSDRVSDTFLHQPFDTEKQREFGLFIARTLGFDFSRGMQAVSAHPFCTHCSINDVRMTTRFDPNYLNTSLFGAMHESGHGMYEQGVSQALEGTVLAGGTSLGVHESQSRLWENLVGRSRDFWVWALPHLKKTFPDQLDGVSLDEFYRAINKVEPSFIRVEADEATYNLHIMLRLELETEVLAGQVAVRDLPEAWNTKFEEYFGLVPPDDAQGVLQDVHWSVGLFGYFATYALGNLLSVPYYNQALADHPEIPDQIRRGQFDTLLKWLNERIHRHGRKFTAEELTRHVTGQSIQPDDYATYLQAKFGDIYGL